MRTLYLKSIRTSTDGIEVPQMIRDGGQQGSLIAREVQDTVADSDIARTDCFAASTGNPVFRTDMPVLEEVAR